MTRKKQMKDQTLRTLIDQIEAAQCIALILHVSPDGDTCGSAYALRRALMLRGKDVKLVCDHKVPHIYADLEGAEEMVTPDAVEGIRFDLAISVDVADCLRMGDAVRVFENAKHTAQIDHHGTNPGYAEVNYLRSPLSATGVLAMEVIDALGVPLDITMAKCLYVAVATDTGNFKQQNTDKDSLVVAARCMAAGLDPSPVTRRVFDLRPVPQVKLLARALESLTTYEDGRIVLMRLAKEDFEAVGALPEHTEGIVNFGINTEGAEIACLMSVPVDKVRCSMRCLPPHDVSLVATDLGGGGHALAAGCTLEPPLEGACALMLGELKKELNRIK